MEKSANLSTSLHNCCTRLFCVEDDDDADSYPVVNYDLYRSVDGGLRCMMGTTKKNYDGHAWSAMLKTFVRHVLHVMDHILRALIAQQVLYSRRSIIFALKYYI